MEKATRKSRSFLRNKSGPKDKKLQQEAKRKRKSREKERKSFCGHQKEKNAIETSIIYSTFRGRGGHRRVKATLNLLMPRLECENVISKILLNRI